MPHPFIYNAAGLDLGLFPGLFDVFLVLLFITSEMEVAASC